MILFDLRCAKDHVFEAWFRDGACFERQAKRGEIACPLCGSRKVVKSPMAPNLARGKTGSKTGEPCQDGTAERHAKLLAALRATRELVEKNFENVGERFPEEARRIHYGEADKRNIYGDATLEDARELNDEGIAVGILPWPRRRTDS